MAAILSRPQCVKDEMINQFKSAFNRWPINMENNATLVFFNCFARSRWLTNSNTKFINELMHIGWTKDKGFDMWLVTVGK